MRRNIYSLLIGVLILAGVTLAGQNSDPSFSIPFVFDIHGLYSFGLEFGIHPSATKGIDLPLGELEYPPFGPPGAYMAMFRTDGGNAILDLRPFTSVTQIDTYRIGFSPDADIYPITFTWPNLSSYYSGPVRLKYDINGSVFDIDMKAQSSYTMSTGPVNDPNGFPGSWIIVDVYVIAEGPLSNTSLPVISTYGVGNGGFQGIVHAPLGGITIPKSTMGGLAGTTTWFEYGQTKSYGSLTTSQLISDGVSMNISSPFDTSSMPPDTRYHFRAVAQNSLGTFYGGDRVISKGTPPPEDTSGNVKYRTASYRDWADAADQKGKRKSIKPKNDKVDFELALTAPFVALLTLKFSIPCDYYIKIYGDPSPPIWTYGAKILLQYGIIDSTEVVHFIGVCHKGKTPTIKYEWLSRYTGKKVKGTVPDTLFTYKKLGLPMPNLHNVGENIYGGVSQTPVQIFVGAEIGAHSILLKKYSNVLKSLVKEKRGGNIYHDQPARCLDVFDNNHNPISKQQASLPPDKHNNSLFAEQLTLKLNIAASDSGIFPPGFGDLIYSHGTSFDGESVRDIADQVDSFLTCPAIPPNNVYDSSIYYNIVHELNGAFSGPMDTISWSGGKVFCTGVKMLSEVPYLLHNPAAVPFMDFAKGQGAIFVQQPEKFALSQNYPNPFNPTTTIEFSLAEPSLVTLKVYNILGQEVQTLLNNEIMDEGDQSYEFDANNLPSGVYFYKITAQGESYKQFQEVKRMMLLK